MCIKLTFNVAQSILAIGVVAIFVRLVNKVEAKDAPGVLNNLFNASKVIANITTDISNC